MTEKKFDRVKTHIKNDVQVILFDPHQAAQTPIPKNIADMIDVLLGRTETIENVAGVDGHSDKLPRAVPSKTFTPHPLNISEPALRMGAEA